MTYVTPLVPAFEKNKMRSVVSGPREETLMLIRHFARIYKFQPGQRLKIRKDLLN